jgi:hypothetical protein
MERRVLTPYSPKLASQMIPTVERIADACRKVGRKDRVPA